MVRCFADPTARNWPVISPPPEESRFPQTRWTLVAQARDGGERTRAAALEGLCQTYWSPVYAFFRAGSASAHDAEDLTQGFFAELLERDLFAKVSAEKGKFRAFLLVSAKNYFSNQRRRGAAQKRGGGVAPLSVDFGDLEALLAAEGDPAPPDLAYERRWAIALLESVLRSMERHYREKGRRELFEALAPTALRAGEAAPGYPEIAARLGMEPGAVRTAAHRMRQRYAKLLRAAVADTLLDRSEVEAELAYLMGLFR